MTRTELEQCIDLYGKDIFSFCRYATGSLQEGEELYQDTFLKAVELMKKMDMSQNPKSFLLSIAVKLWKNKQRKYAWRQRIAGMESLEEKGEYQNIPSNLASALPEESLLQKEQKQMMYQCIRELLQKYQLLLYLYYASDLSVNEIAVLLKMPEGTVKSRLHKARKLLKEQLEDAGYDK